MVPSPAGEPGVFCYSGGYNHSPSIFVLFEMFRYTDVHMGICFMEQPRAIAAAMNASLWTLIIGHNEYMSFAERGLL